MIKDLAIIKPNETNYFGGKAVNLSILIRNNILVPPGFAISYECNLNNEKVLYKWFDKYNFKYVAIRSSATAEDGKLHSFAGQFESYLNISKKDFIGKIKMCRDSKYSNRLKTYCAVKKIDFKNIKVGVIVQRMIQSEYSGVVFTKNPINGKKEMIIEIVKGLGDGLVSGQVSPDKFIISKDKKTPNSKYYFLSKLINISKKIRSILKYEVDIEWAIENGELHILQARPITT